MYDLNRFKKAQNSNYRIALEEVKAGRKTSHWIWYIFPQLKGLGFSGMSDYYGIDGLGEAKAYLADPSVAVFRKVLDRFYNGKEDQGTIRILKSRGEI